MARSTTPKSEMPPEDKASKAENQSESLEADERRGTFFVVIGPQNGRWRSGLHFTREPTQVFIEDLTEAQAAAIFNDPVLAVSVVDPDTAQP